MLASFIKGSELTFWQLLTSCSLLVLPAAVHPSMRCVAGVLLQHLAVERIHSDNGHGNDLSALYTAGAGDIEEAHR